VYGPPAASPDATITNGPVADCESSTVTVLPLSVEAVHVQVAFMVLATWVQLRFVGANTGIVTCTVFDGAVTPVTVA
jgi:hypothetical protein